MAKISEDALNKLCDKDLSKKETQYNLNFKLVSARAKAVTTPRAIANFKDTPFYEWARFAAPDSIGKLLEPGDKDLCAKYYKTFIDTKNAKVASEKLELWRACLNSDYRDEIPQMAKDLLSCHGAKATEDLHDNEKAAKEDKE